MNKAKTIGILSIKGGVGKTSAVAALIGEEYNDPRFVAKLKNLFKKLPKQDVNRDKIFLER